MTGISGEMRMTDYYRMLGVSPQADENEIRKAYRSLAKRYHPDAHPGDAQCEARFREISEAYHTLGDAEKRRRYDAARSAQSGRTGGGGREAKDGTDAAAPMSEFERFFGFRPGQGMETYRDRRGGGKTAAGARKPEEKFASIFKNIK